MDNYQIAYQKFTDDWYIVSYEDNEQIFYNKFIISYPAKKKDKYGPITTHIAKTFAPSAQ